MEIKPGYKQTEVGVIPEDWEVKELGYCLLAKPEYGINAAAVPYTDDLPTYIRITDITEDGRFSRENIASVRTSEVGKFKLHIGDIVFARTGASTGKTYLYNPTDGELVFAGFLIRVRVNPKKLDPIYLANYTKTAAYWNWVRVMSMRSGQPGINGEEYAQLPVPVPPLPEQQRIAAVLSDVDALLAAQDALIAKKRDIKQGAMQELLTGKKRVAGFDGEWEQTKIGEIAQVISGGTPSTLNPDYWGGSIRWMNSGELHLKRVHEVEGRITETGLNNSSTRLIPPRCVLIGLAGQGRTRGTVAMNMVELCTNQSIAAILPDDSFVPEFLYHNLDARYDELRNISTGQGGRGALNLGIIKSLSVKLPRLAEQLAIAEILSDMDAEIEALEQQRAKYQSLKQGMMQELLTGKIRLML